MPILTIQNKSGAEILAGEQRITPISQVVQVRLPGMQGGFVWNRPLAVRVQAADGSQQVLPVEDITRITQLSLVGLGLVGGLLIWLVARR